LLKYILEIVWFLYAFRITQIHVDSPGLRSLIMIVAYIGWAYVREMWWQLF